MKEILIHLQCSYDLFITISIMDMYTFKVKTSDHLKKNYLVPLLI